jgi:hypothetical protein
MRAMRALTDAELAGGSTVATGLNDAQDYPHHRLAVDA